MISQPVAALSASLATLTNVSCFGASTGSVVVNVVGGTAPYTYSWSSGQTTKDIANVPAGFFVVVVCCCLLLLLFFFFFFLFVLIVFVQKKDLTL